MASISWSKRTVALVVAVALAAVATVALVSYVQGVEDKAFEGVETVEVYIASELIPGGTTGDSAISQGLVEKTMIAKKTRAPTAIVTLEEIRGKVAAVDIFPNEQIIAQRFVSPGQARGSLAIPQGQQAVSVQVNLPAGVSGFIKPGDRVSLVAQFRQVDRQGRTPPGEDRIVKYLLQNVQVLAVGQRTIASATSTRASEDPEERAQPRGNVLLTLALTASQIERLVFGVFNGDLYFTLLPAGARPVDTPGRTGRNVLP